MKCLIIANGIASLGGAIVLSYIVLNERIKEGAVIRIGLVMMLFSLVATAAHTLQGTGDWDALWAAAFTLRIGMLVVGLGLIWRRWMRGSWDAAVTDWDELPHFRDRIH